MKEILKATGVLCAICVMTSTVQAEVTVVPNNPTIAPTAEEQQIIDILENDIRILDEEIAKCEKKKKGWIAATVIGGVGVAATGTAAIVQGVKIGEQKEALADKNRELENIKNQTNLLK